MHEDVRVAGELLLLPHAVAVARTDAEVTQALAPQRKVRRLAVLLLAELVFAAVAADSNVVTVEVHRQRMVVAGNLRSEQQQQQLLTVVDIIQLLVVAVGIPDLVVAIRRQQRPLALLHAVTGGAAVVALSLNCPDGKLVLAAAEAVEKLLRLLATAAVVHAAVVGRRVAVVPPAAVAVGVLLAVVVVVAAAVIDLETAATFSVLLDLQNDPWYILRFSARL